MGMLGYCEGTVGLFWGTIRASSSSTARSSWLTTERRKFEKHEHTCHKAEAPRPDFAMAKGVPVMQLQTKVARMPTTTELQMPTTTELQI